MKRATPFLLVGGLLAILFAIEMLRPRPYDERLLVERSGAQPFSSEMLFRLLPAWLEAPVEARDDVPFLVLADTTITEALYVFITDSFEPDRDEAARIVRFAERGNTVLMAAEDFGGPLSWSLGDPRSRRARELAQETLDSLMAESDEMDPYQDEDVFEAADDPAMFWDGLDTEHLPPFAPVPLTGVDTLYLDDPTLAARHPEGFAFEFTVGAAPLIGMDSARTAVLGRNEEGEPTLVRVGVGEGAFLVSSTPLAFTNAALALGDGAAYLEGVFGYVPPVQRVFWDGTYKPFRDAGSPLGVVARTPALSWAIALIVLSGLLFLLFRGRRWQRPIPVVAPPPNAQREFARVLGRLHFVRGDRGWLARRKTRVFEDHVRTRLGIPDADLTDRTARLAAARAGVAPDRALALFQMLRNLRADPAPEPERLVAADQAIDAFFARSQDAPAETAPDPAPVA